jgi:hypothetical protein
MISLRLKAARFHTASTASGHPEFCSADQDYANTMLWGFDGERRLVTYNGH